MPPMFKWIGERFAGPSSASSTSGSLPSSTFSTPRKDNDLSIAFASDPMQWEKSFEKLWIRGEKIIEKKEYDQEHEISYDEMTNFVHILKEMCQLLMMEVNAQPEPAIGPILDKFFTQQILERTMDWAIQVPITYKPVCQLAVIRVYDVIVSESHTQNHCLLVHKPVLIPLLRLFEWCRRDAGSRQRPRGTEPSPTDKHFVLLLYQICTKMASDPTLLHFFFTCTEGADQFVVFSLLIRFLYDQNDVGQLARDALLLILSVSSKNKAVAEFVAFKSSFCPVLATGLSGCFSQLSRFLGADQTERFGYSPIDRAPTDAMSQEAITDFHSSLLFCNAVVQASHSAIVEKISQFFYSGFLMSVVKPALLQDEREGAAAATLYLQICIGAVTEESLLRMIIRMLLIERDDVENEPIINTVISRISIADRLGTVSLALLDDLLQLGCEDIMLVLAFRSLLPLRHATKHDLVKVRDRQHSVKVAERLLACVPECALKYDEVASALTVNLYLRESAALVQRRAASCARWKWKYDGILPSPLLFRTDSDDDYSVHSAFSRVSSVRSSMNFSSRGMNRYFTSRNGHLTTESNLGQKLVSLGESAESPIQSRSSSPILEDSEFVLPPISSSSLMTSSMVDYFQLVAYDDLSDDPPSSPERNNSLLNDASSNHISNFQNGHNESAKEEKNLSSEGESARGFDTDAEMARSFVLSGWAEVEDMETFKNLLNRRAIKNNKTSTISQNMSFIDSKIQYIKELSEMSKNGIVDAEEVPAEKDISPDEPLRGQPIEATDCEKFHFIHLLLDQLAAICDHPLAYNMQLARVLLSLATYPQPLLAAFLFCTDVERGPRIVSILESLKKYIDAYAQTVEGVDVFIGRAVRQLNGRADRYERHADLNVSAIRYGDSPREETGFSRSRQFGGSGRRSYYKYHSHKVVESREAARGDEMTKCVVHSAIILAHLAQQLAGIVLYYPVVTLHHSNTQN